MIILTRSIPFDNDKKISSQKLFSEKILPQYCDNSLFMLGLNRWPNFLAGIKHRPLISTSALIRL